MPRAKQTDWSAGITQRVGELVARYRRQGKLSAQAVADRCAALGMPSITRIVITRLENELRDSLTIPELMVIAAALDVPPMALIFPHGTEDIEVLPGRHLDPWAAVVWFTGPTSWKTTITPLPTEPGGWVRA